MKLLSLIRFSVRKLTFIWKILSLVHQKDFSDQQNMNTQLLPRIYFFWANFYSKAELHSNPFAK